MTCPILGVSDTEFENLESKILLLEYCLAPLKKLTIPATVSKIDPLFVCSQKGKKETKSKFIGHLLSGNTLST